MAPNSMAFPTVGGRHNGRLAAFCSPLSLQFCPQGIFAIILVAIDSAFLAVAETAEEAEPLIMKKLVRGGPPSRLPTRYSRTSPERKRKTGRAII